MLNSSEAQRTRQAGRKLSTELAETTPTSRLVAYLTAAIAVTVVGALVALALAFRAGDHGSRRRAPAPAVESEIDVSELAAPPSASASAVDSGKASAP